ncbi:hypothetical protein ILUMI_26260 [Ignelater luminosus]|uniref:DUF4371 domain-containing protein n=1 Tax=Ignelater luminosus TaxID=2038154 RepID=A0A8K0FYV3_IGNLU|nr:hypothetical protein ILUMI_26260 [Ignelater luminosus]
MSGGTSRDRDIGRKWESGASKKRKAETVVKSRASRPIKRVILDLDPGNWVFPVTDSQRHDLIQKGLDQNLEKSDESYPKDANKRHFLKFHFARKLSNGETQHRRWLVYSISQNKVYCFPCRLFSHLQTQIVKEGCCDWKDLSRILQRLEQSQEHVKCMIKWMEFYKGIKHGKTIDKENERLIRESQKYWYNLFERLTDIINYLASHNLAFRAHRESLNLNNSGNSGNFIDLFKLLSKYDLTLREHLQRINEKQLNQHYLSHDIQNELITLMSKSVIDEIIHRVKQAKYYTFLLDCTRNVNRIEQTSIILRFCNSSTGAVEEHFVEFISVTKTTGEYLTNTILQELERNGLDIQSKHCNDLGTILREGENGDEEGELQLLKSNSLDSAAVRVLSLPPLLLTPSIGRLVARRLTGTAGARAQAVRWQFRP